MGFFIGNKMEDLVILYEDNHIIVVLKPQNVPSQEDASKDLDMLTIIKDCHVISKTHYAITIIAFRALYYFYIFFN